MLQQLRDTTKTFVSYVLLVLLVLSFGIWGIGDIFRNINQRDWVAKVDGTKIGVAQLERQFQGEVAQMRAMLGPSFTNAKAREMGMLERSLSNLIAVTALNMEMKKLGLDVPRAQIIRMLEKTPQLRNKDGSFNKALFQQMIGQQGFTEAMFIDNQKQIIARNMLVTGLSLPVVVPDVALHDLAAAAAQKRVGELVRILPAELASRQPSADELQKFYDDNKGSYKTPERRDFKILSITPADSAKDLAITDDELKAGYDAHKSQIEQPEKRDLVQVVVDTEEKAKALAEAAKQSNLNNAAKAESLDPVKMDAIAEKDLPKSIAEKVFKLEANAVSEPMQSELGWHVFTVKKITPGTTVTFEEAKEPLRKILRADKAAESMVAVANKVDDMLAGNKSIDDIAASQDLKTVSYENRDSTGHLPGEDKAEKLPFAIDALRAAFNAKEGQNSNLIELKDGGYMVVTVTKITPAAEQPLEDVKDKMIAAWQTQDRMASARAKAKEIAEQMKAGSTLAQVSGVGIKKSTTPAVTLDDKGNKDLPREALAPLFGMKPGESTSVSTAEGELVIRVKDVVAGSDKEIATRQADMKTGMTQEWATSQLNEFTNALRTLYPVQIDEKALNQLNSPVNTGDNL